MDIGTTTLALKLFDLTDGRELGSCGAWNSQSSFGADVISRCQYVIEHDDGLELMKERIQIQVFSLIYKLMDRSGREKKELEELFVVGNTVMEHIFMGLSPAGMALAPFKPLTLFMEKIPVYIKNIKTFALPAWPPMWGEMSWRGCFPRDWGAGRG